MAEDETREGGLTVVPVPSDKVQAVIDFLATLESDTADVSGHMIPNAAIGGGVGASAGRSLTACWGTDDPVTGHDWSCSDSDKSAFHL
ncbi:MAG TPA: hypothetical protein VHV31_01545 [Nitrolancea sp.]|nr:hypothetical protein [Nitrolancea sp.]